MKRLATIFQSLFLMCFVYQTSAQIKLNQLSDFQEPSGNWIKVGKVEMDSSNPEILKFEKGDDCFINGADGKAKYLVSKKEYQDVEFHAEFMIPKGSNSGIYFQCRYEVQLFDSWGATDLTYYDCGGIQHRFDKNKKEGEKDYDGFAPMVNACKAPGVWQSLDVIFRSPKFNSAGVKVKNASFEKVILNGIVVQENVELPGPTRGALSEKEVPFAPFRLQGGHGPVAFRNISARGLEKKSDQSLELWYDAPAADWNEALPLGNGRLGAMVFGIPDKENIQLNEATLWAGGPHRNDNPEAKAILDEIRQLLFDGNYKAAHDLANAKIISKTSHGMNYETVGNLRLNFKGHNKYSKYYRELDIKNAISKTNYTVDGVDFQREMFTSFTDQVLVIKLTASKNGKINFSTTMDRPAPSVVEVSTEGNHILKMTGTSSDLRSRRTPKNTPPIKGMVDFQSRLKVVPDGGDLSSTDSTITLTGANSATLYISIATNFVNYNDVSADANQRAETFLTNAENKSYSNLRADHIAYYQEFFKRVSLNLGTTDSIKNPTDVRIKDFSKSNDPALAALYFQYGRYLLICSSQPGGQASNLQGIWCNDLNPPWKSAYTVNINTEMNYWPAEPTNLSEMHEPLISLVKDLSVTGQQTASDMYGANGWVCHHNTDLWRICGPVDGATWGMWPSGGLWLSQHLWEKYLYSGDLQYLKEVYPAMKGSAEFCLSFLTPEPKHGWLIFAPSTSPENRPAHFPNMVNMAYGATMDNQLIFDMLTKTAEAAKILGADAELVKQIEVTIPKLAPTQIGQHAQIQEWIHDWDSPDDKHRHISQLYAMHPSNQFSPFRTPELAEAARNVLIYRGDPSTGWSMNWKINQWARLLDGNHAYKMMTDQIKLVGRPDSPKGGGTYANMLDAHPPFQIDGNFGFTSGLTEMMMQSHDGAIHLLPALPDVWKDGKVTGLRARGGFEIESMEWENGQLVKAVIKSNLGGNCRIRSYSELIAEDGTSLTLANGDNENPFYQVPSIQKPLISEKADLRGFELTPTYLYDISTTSGQKVVLQNVK